MCTSIKHESLVIITPDGENGKNDRVREEERDRKEEGSKGEREEERVGYRCACQLVNLLPGALSSIS